MARVLVADDKSTNREFLTTLLGYGGHQLLEAANGAEALEQVRAEHPDLVIADVLMPVMDGYEFVRQLRADPEINTTRVIFYTASYHEREARALARSCGVHQLLIKPAEPEQILATVAEALNATHNQAGATGRQEFDRGHLRLLTDKLSENVNALEASNQRLADLLEVSRLLASEYEADQLLAKFCPAARELIGARFAFVGVLSEDQQILKPLFFSGLDSETAANVLTLSIDHGVLYRLCQENGPVQIRDVREDPVVLGLPVPNFEKRSFLGIRLCTSTGLYGLLWLLEKLGGEQFTEGDERVLVSLAAQVGVAYENAQRYRDIQNHAAELELCVEKRTAELQASNADLEAFSYSVSHDLRGPLMHLSGYSSILLDKYGITLNEEANGFLHRINQAAMRMSHLIDDLLKLAKVSRQQLDFQEVSLGSLVEEVIKGLDVDGHVPKIDWRIGPLPHIQCDYGLMRQVLINLLSNAVKYTGTRDRPEIEIGHKTIDDRPTLFVRDNGVGFDMKHADKLFAPFERLHRDQDFQGSGVGLATVQRIIGKHGGRIWAEAEAGIGATFYFTVASEVPSITPHPYQPATAV